MLSEDRLKKIFEENFGINLNECVVNFEVIYKHKDNEKYERIKKEYEHHLLNHPRKEEVKKQFYVSDDLMIHLQHYFKRNEFDGIGPDEYAYYPVCTIDEILRIKYPTCANDLLLKLRADAIADHPRITRVYLSKYNKNKDGWCLTKNFDDSPFTIYKEKLSKNLRDRCESIPAGFIFMKDPNGICEKTKFGNIIYISESLKYYLYFMNMFIVCNEISLYDRFHSFLIAVRTMLLNESLDFDLDNRGDLPENIDMRLKSIVKDQIDFIIGHEYAHHLLGHLGNATVSKSGLYLVGDKDDGEYYNHDQLEEFEADKFSITHANYGDEERDEIVNGAVIFFVGLQLFDYVRDFLYPPNGSVRSHPDPIDRMWKLHHAFANGNEFYSAKDLELLLTNLEEFKSYLLKEFLPFQVDTLEFVGSVYLPSYRREVLIDRFDF